LADPFDKGDVKHVCLWKIFNVHIAQSLFNLRFETSVWERIMHSLAVRLSDNS
jgi:hypothetical protein